MEFWNKSFAHLVSNPIYLVPIVLLLGVVIFLAIVLILKKWPSERVSQVLGIVIASLFLIVMAAAEPRRWQWLIALLPSLMVGYQVFYLWLHHPRGANGISTRTSQEGQKQYDESKKRAEDTIQKQFGLKTLFIRYGLPAMLLGITGHVFINILVAPNSFFSLIESINGQAIRDATDERILLGIKFGTLGAYIYILLELGRRTFRHDITGASAMWCLVTLVLGPVLAATVSVLWRMDSPQATGGWGASVVLFFTGFAPRRVIAAIEQAAAQLLRLGPQTVVETRLIPLSKFAGLVRRSKNA